MNRSLFLLPIAGICCLASLCSVSAPARAQNQFQTQDLRSMRQSFQASGILSWGDQRQSVQRVRVELDEDGDARLKFDGQTREGNWGWREGDWRDWNANQEIDGVWLRDERGITIDLRHGLGDQTVVGTARITMADDFGRLRPREMTLTGRVARQPWNSVELGGRLSFDSWGGGNPNGGGPIGGGGIPGPIYNNRLDEFSTIKRGGGELSDDGQPTDISRANVQLNRDGTAQIVLSGDREYAFGGRWRQTSPSRIELRIDTFAVQTDRGLREVPRPDRDANPLGGGEIRIDGTRLLSIRLSGTRGNRDFDVRFEPEGDNWNGGNNGGWNQDRNDGWPGTPDWNGNRPDGNGGWNGNPGGNRPGGWNGNWGGGWKGNGNGNDNGGWNGNPAGNGNTPPRPLPETDLHGAWKGWTGEGIKPAKGSLPAPSPQAPTQERPRRPWRDPAPEAPVNNAPRPVTPPPPTPVSAPDPTPEQPKSQPADPPKRERREEKPREEKPREEKPREDKPKEKEAEKPTEKDNSDSQESEKGRPRARVGKPR